MKLSIIIVNYNVKYFLEQTLRSVRRSSFDGEYEVIVVDNDSEDGSMTMVNERFPEVMTICNQENVGFSKANNQGIAVSRGEYILLLNPDTILAEDTLDIVISRMDNDPRIGGLGVRMIDGGGHFLPESKRGLPTPFVAFCKAFHLSSMFPESRRFNYYHLGHIPEDQSSEVDVLSGAFMLMRRSVIEEVGALDETFFMYGEDIDLSYRIQKAGYVNWYEAGTSIVHFKGESTKRGSLNYVKVFYQAMIIFANKHFVGKGAFFMSLLYKMAVIFRATLSLIHRFLKRLMPVLLDGVVIFAGLQIIAHLWATHYFGDTDYYRSVPLKAHHAIYTFMWLGTMYIGGVYDRYFKLRYLHRSLILGTVILLIAFSLMSSEWRPSRAILLMGAGWSLVSLTILRTVLAKLSGFSERSDKRIGVVGSQNEISRTLKLLSVSGVKIEESVSISPMEDKVPEGYKGKLEDLDHIIEAYQLDEIIFCAKDVENMRIMHWMTRLSNRVPIKIIQEKGVGVIGSRYKNRQGEWYAIDARMSITQPERRRQKRLVDVILSVFSLILFPVTLLLPRAGTIFRHIFAVLVGQMTWIAYKNKTNGEVVLPRLRPGVFSPTPGIVSEMVSQRVNYLYAKDYTPWMDFELFWKSAKQKKDDR